MAAADLYSHARAVAADEGTDDRIAVPPQGCGNPLWRRRRTMNLQTKADAREDAPRRRNGRRSWLGLLVPALLVFAVLIGLGVWQIQRKAWKEGLIVALTERLVVPPEAMPKATAWPQL